MAANIAIGLALGLIAIGVVATLGVGIKNVINGRSDVKRVSVMIVPAAVFGVSYASFGQYGEAAMATLLIMMGLMALAIVISSTRGTFKL